MKKCLALILTAFLLLNLAACTTPAKETDPAHETEPVVSLADSKLKVGILYIGSQNTSSGDTYAHHSGLTAAMEQLELDPGKRLLVADEVPADNGQILKAIAKLVKKGADIIFGTDPGYADTMEEAAQKYPDVIFAHAAGYRSSTTNFSSYAARAYQAWYLAGIAAGAKSLELGNGNLGFVSAYAAESAQTAAACGGFTLGAMAVNPNAKVYVKAVGSWSDPAGEATAAKELIDACGCCVIAQYCDSALPQITAQRSGVFGCGSHCNMTMYAPDAHLTAPVWHWEVYYKKALLAAASCDGAKNFVSKMGAGAYCGGLKEKLADISPLSRNCADGTRDAVKQVRDLIESGSWDVFSGVKLGITLKDGSATVEQVDSPLIDSNGNTVVPAGEPSLEDETLTELLNFLVAGAELS